MTDVALSLSPLEWQLWYVRAATAVQGVWLGTPSLLDADNVATTAGGAAPAERAEVDPAAVAAATCGASTSAAAPALVAPAAVAACDLTTAASTISCACFLSREA